jgi:hypothetical protein
VLAGLAGLLPGLLLLLIRLLLSTALLSALTWLLARLLLLLIRLLLSTALLSALTWLLARLLGLLSALILIGHSYLQLECEIISRWTTPR